MALSKIEADSLDIGQVGGRRNLIINGAMQVAQRGTSSVNGNGSFPVDRFAISNTQASKYTGQQSSTAPANFKNSVVLTSSSAYTVVAGDAFNFYQRMEGYDVAHLGFGTSDAQEFTLSFYVRSSLTGTFAGFLSNADYNRSYVFEYTIDTADTWERKTITLTADTTGTWGTTNGRGLSVHWSLGTGSTYHTTAGSWQAGNYQSTSSATNLVGTNGATLYITGVQLEVGDTATPFEHRSYGEELALCQRYFEKSYSSGTAPGTNTTVGMVRDSVFSIGNNTAFKYLSFKVAKRAAPTMTAYRDGGASGKWYYARNGQATESTVTFNHTGTEGTNPTVNIGTSWTGANTYGHWTADAEL